MATAQISNLSRDADQTFYYNIVDQLAKQAAVCGTDLELNISDTPAIRAIQTTPIDIKQHQKDLWVTDGELTTVETR